MAAKRASTEQQNASGQLEVALQAIIQQLPAEHEGKDHPARPKLIHGNYFLVASNPFPSLG